MRVSNIDRKTKETSIQISVSIDGNGRSNSKTDIKFLDHMLDAFSTHSLIDLSVKAKGDLQHHLVEDVAITLGQALNEALGDRTGIRRFGHAIVPMDESLAVAAVDLVRRPYSLIQLNLERVIVEDAPREDLEHFFSSLATSLVATVHVKTLDGKNDHHKYEAAIKALALAFRDAATVDPRRKRKRSSTPSSKGVM